MRNCEVVKEQNKTKPNNNNKTNTQQKKKERKKERKEEKIPLKPLPTVAQPQWDSISENSLSKFQREDFLKYSVSHAVC